MKKNFLFKMAAMIAAISLTGCGAEPTANEAVNTESQEIVTDAAESQADEEESEEAVEQEETTEQEGTVEVLDETPAQSDETSETKADGNALPYSAFSKTFQKDSYGYGIDNTWIDDRDRVTKYAVKKEAENYYYVGKNDSSATNFAKNHPHDKVLYLGKPMYLPATMDENAYYVSVDDEAVAKIEGDELVPLMQGCFVLSSYDKDGNKLEEVNYIVTTYNDSKSASEVKSGVSFDKSIYKNNLYSANPIKEIDYWRTHCSTLMDVSYYFQARGFYYSSEGEPEGNFLGGDILDDWMWNNDIQTIFEANKGVCLQAAQLAVHFLADDFEDWGVVCIDGNQGHIFNWFYEDEKYYVFDYTEIISDNRDFYRDIYKDYSHNVQVFHSYEEMCDWITTSGKVDLSQNYLVYEYSLQGFDDLPANTHTGKCDTYAVVRGETDEVVYSFQDIILDDLNIIWVKDGLTINFRGLSEEEMSSRISHGIIGKDEEYHFYYNY